MVVRKALHCLKAMMPITGGLCLGIFFSLLFAPAFDESCDLHGGQMEKFPHSAKSDHLGPGRSLNEKLNFDYSNSDDFEPKLRPHEEHAVAANGPRRLIRPRYASTELGIREKLFVGVITTKDSINSLGVAVNKTLAHYVPKLVFFMDRRGPKIPTGMAIVSFPDGRTKLKPFHMLKYVYDHYGNNFDYYMFIPDKTYVRGEKVLSFVSDISMSLHVHLGQPIGQLDPQHVFCSLAAGVVISQSVLSSVVDNLEWCAQNALASEHADNLGRCIIHSTDQKCTAQILGKEYRYVANKDLDFDKEIDDLRKTDSFNKALTVSTVQDDITMYKLHRYFCQLEYNETKQQIDALQKSIINISQLTPDPNEHAGWPVGVQQPFRPKNRYDVLRWDYFTEKHIYLKGDFSTVEELKGIDKQDVADILKTAMTKLNQKHNNRFTYHRLVNGYRRFDPSRGMEYTLDLELKDTSSPENNDKIYQRRVHLVRPLSLLEIIPMPYVTENSKVNLILPIMASDRDGVVSFLDSYAHTCLDAGDNTDLLIVFIYDPAEAGDDSFSVLKSMITYYENKYQNGAKITSLSLRTSSPTQLTIIEAISRKFKPDSILLMCTVGMELSIDFLNRVRMNTIANWQVFFPVGFYQYKPNLIYEEKPFPTVIDINRNFGHFDVHSFDHASFYNSDFIRCSSNKTSKELARMDLFELFVQEKKLHIFRAVEPALKHRYRQRICNPVLAQEQYQRCLRSRAEGLANSSQLAMLIFEHQKKVDKSHLQVIQRQRDPIVNHMKPDMLKR
ncbi:chondroitin sulfate synthase 2 [Lingula anatina]|uniref:Hexosyltransferase n=1 Tax=Lingula anatina TaxID=7574 RepID=A0A1S3IB52_LINAN|nr:chondroitin sulfate synthase 2 [Lingula anatina]|eukprot:XP_013394634.1 chondroitin sulfate synthase 2 [Lingula anatina]